MGDRLPIRRALSGTFKRWPRGLPARILVAAAFVALFTGVIVLVRTAEWVSTSMIVLLSDSDNPTKQANIAACLADPKSFAARGPGGSEIHAYDRRTLRSSNPASPPLDPALMQKLEHTSGAISKLHWRDPKWGGVALDPIATSGPCSLFQIRWRRADALRRRGMINYVMTLGLIVGVGMFAAFVLAVRPSVQRILTLERRSRSVGLPEDFVPGDEPHDDAIARLGRTVNEAHERLVQASSAQKAQQKALRRHLAQVAHDLRTPLSASQLAIEEALTTTPAEHHGPLLEVLDDMVYMDGLTNNLHLASRMERIAGPLHGGHRVDLGQVVDFVVARFRILGRRHEIEVSGSRPDGPVWVDCDPAMAQQAIANLVHNAVAHGRAGGHCALLLETTPDGFEVRVLDDGPGLNAQQHAQLKVPLQASSTTGKTQGLGVRIVRSVCAHAGWIVDFERPGHGQGLEVRIKGPLSGPPSADG